MITTLSRTPLLGTILFAVLFTSAGGASADMERPDTEPVAGSESANAEAEPNFAPLTRMKMNPRNHWRAVVAEGDQLWLAYYDDVRALWLLEPDGSHYRLDEKEEGQAPSGLAMIPKGPGAQMAWRDKVPVKGLFLMDTSLGDPVEVSGRSEALARFKLLPGATGTHVVWYGEMLRRETGSRYNLHYNFVHPDGRTDEQQWLMPGMYPVALADGDDIAVFSWAVQGVDRPQIAMRKRTAGADEFADPIVLDQGVENISPLFMAESSGDHWVVLWQTIDRDGQFGFSVDGARSSDRGASWERFTIDALKGFDTGHMGLVMDGEKVTVAVSGRWGEDAERLGDQENRVYVVHSPDGGASWNEPQSLRDEDEASRLRNVHIITGYESGEVWVLWEDWRQIRPRVFGAYSTDFGSGFEWNDRAVSPPELDRVGLAAFQPVHVRRADGIQVIGSRYTSDLFSQVELVPFTLDAKPISEPEALPERKTDPDRVRARSTEYWQAMTEKDYDHNFTMLDPFLREAWHPIDYTRRLGRIVYRDPEVLDVTLDGYQAHVRVRVNAEVPRFEHRGAVIEVPEREVTISERWLFIDGDWFREYEEEGSGIRLTRYR